METNDFILDDDVIMYNNENFNYFCMEFIKDSLSGLIVWFDIVDCTSSEIQIQCGPINNHDLFYENEKIVEEKIYNNVIKILNSFLFS